MPRTCATSRCRCRRSRRPPSRRRRRRPQSHDRCGRPSQHRGVPPRARLCGRHRRLLADVPRPVARRPSPSRPLRGGLRRRLPRRPP
ncbi:MAG: hypothetical protein E6G66_18520, partial [Actinobacteria bacterium]